MDEANCRRGRKRHNPVSSIHTRASSNVSAACPFKRILSARDASNCSAVKEKPQFQVGVQAVFRATAGSPEFLYGLGILKVTSIGLFGPILAGPLKRRAPGSVSLLRASGATYPNHSKCELDSMEGPQYFLPRIEQSYWTSVGATCWMLSLCKLQK